MLTSKKCHLAKFCKVDAWSQALLLREKQVFPVGLSFFKYPDISVHIGKLTNTSLYATGIKAQKKEPKRISDIVVRKCLRSKYQNSDDQDGEVREQTRLHALQAFYPTQEPHRTKSNEQVNEQRSIKIPAILAKITQTLLTLHMKDTKRKQTIKR